MPNAKEGSPEHVGPLADWWRQFTFVKGFLSQQDRARAREFALLADESATEFFMVQKTELDVSQGYIRPAMFSSSICLELLPQAGTPSRTTFKSLRVPVKNPGALTKLSTHNITHLFVRDKDAKYPMQKVKVRDLEMTAGVLFMLTLQKLSIVTTCTAQLCPYAEKKECRNGKRCLFAHFAGEYPPVEPTITMIESKTRLTEALQKAENDRGFRAFMEQTLPLVGFNTVGDVQTVTNAIFDAFGQRLLANVKQEGKEQFLEFWPLVQQLRDFDPQTPVFMALLQFPGISEDDIDVAMLNAANVLTVESLCALKPRAFYALPWPALLMTAAEKIRSRFMEKDQVLSTISLSKLPEKSFYLRLSQEVVAYREHHAHVSWRKKDDTRPIVTSAITYVSDTCQCHKGREHSTTTIGMSPMLGPRPRVYEDSADYPADSWCHCPRKWEMAVNYELSTPSGSRCSEQNCLGKLASMGLATESIREVFVHGSSPGAEPNPLFPCGVCENMLRRISKDVLKKSGGDVMLFMFDVQENCKKLISIPMNEISHRDGTSFRRFLEDDVRDDTE